MAVVRAEESRRRDRLFDDPLAQAFVDRLPSTFAKEQEAAATTSEGATLGALFAFHAVIRTRFFDDYLLGACEAGCRQVVLVAAGLDTRAYRLAWPPNVRLFELDLPDVLELKEDVLTREAAVPRCERTAVPVDVREDWSPPLVEAGLRPAAPTAWLVEGLLIYLSASEAASLLTAIAELSAVGSRLAFEDANDDDPLAAGTRAMPGMKQFTALWKGGVGRDAPRWLAQHGWEPHLRGGQDVAGSYGRTVPRGWRGGFLTATRLPGAHLHAESVEPD